MVEIQQYYECEFLKMFRKQDVHAIRGMLDEAYTINNQLYSRDTFLNETDIGAKDVRAHNLRAAIAKMAKLYCSKGILPYEFATPFNNLGNCRHVELRFNKKTLYLARIDYPNCVPRKAQYRPVTPTWQTNLFYDQEINEKPIDVFLATYGDAGADEFKFGNVGIIGEVSWLYAYPLIQGVYKYITNEEKEEILVELTETALRKDEYDAEGEES